MTPLENNWEVSMLVLRGRCEGCPCDYLKDQGRKYDRVQVTERQLETHRRGCKRPLVTGTNRTKDSQSS